MALEQIFVSQRTLTKLRLPPLGGYLDGFCDHLLVNGFTWHTSRRHVANASHLNTYLNSQGIKLPLSGKVIDDFFRSYPLQARNRGALEKHIAQMHRSINRLVEYLDSINCYEPADSPPETAIYQALLDAYLNWLSDYQALAPSTVELRSGYLRQFLDSLGSDATVHGCQKLTAASVEQYFMTYAKQSGQSAQRSMQATLRTFFRFCLQEGIIHRPLDYAVPKIATYSLSTVPSGLSDEQALQVLKCIDHTTPEGARDYAICQLLYTYGVRNRQICQLCFDDIDWINNTIHFKALKHGKDSDLPLTMVVGEGLLDYIQNNRPICSTSYVFLTTRAPYHALNSSRSSTLSYMTSHYIQIAGIELASKGTHVFRHCLASRMLEQGHSLKAIADVLGHRHLSSTLHYAKIDFSHLKQVALPWPKGE
jgi:integrase/recombinase XerD